MQSFGKSNWLLNWFVCVGASVFVGVDVSPQAHRKQSFMPGVCFIFSGLCLAPRAAECTAWGWQGRLQEGKQRRPSASCCVCLLFKEKADVLCLCLASSFEEDAQWALAHIQGGFPCNRAMDHCPVGCLWTAPFPARGLCFPALPGLQPACSPNAPSAFSSSGSSCLPARTLVLPFEVNPNSPPFETLLKITTFLEAFPDHTRPHTVLCFL